MSINVKTSDGARAYALAEKYNLPVTTVTSLCREWDKVRIDEIKAGRDVSIVGLGSFKLIDDEFKNTVRLRSNVSGALRRYIDGLGKEGFRSLKKADRVMLSD